MNLTSFPNPAVRIHTDGAEDVHDGEGRNYTNTSKVHKIRVRDAIPNPSTDRKAKENTKKDVAAGKQNEHDNLQKKEQAESFDRECGNLATKSHK